MTLMTATTETATTETFLIPDENLRELQAKIAKLSRRAEKLGSDPITLSVLDTLRNERTDEYGLTTVTIRHVVQVSGRAPQYDGWTFVATLEPFEETMLVRVVPGEELPAAYRTATQGCDHCHTVRRRNETFVVRHATGAHKQVGRNCLADFLGHADPSALARIAQYLAEARELAEEAGYERGMARVHRLDLLAFLGYAAESIRRHGWVSRTKAREQGGAATADVATGMLLALRDRTPPYRGCTEWREGRREFWLPTEESKQLAHAALDWARSWTDRDPADLSDYQWNVRVLVTPEFPAVTLEQVGIAASIVAVYQRELERDNRRRAERAALASSQHVGTVGKREEFEVTVLGSRRFETRFGVTELVTMIDPAGNVLKWFSSRDSGLQPERRYRIAGSVKEHGEYAGVLETTLTRVRVIDELGA